MRHLDAFLGALASPRPLAALLPWLVHLIGKRRALPVRFAAMQLLLRAERRISARRRLREILLLVARTGVAAALPLIFARPFAERTTDLPVASLDPQSAVIVLDDSASMSRSAGLSTMFERARDRARALVRQFPSDVDLALLLASAGSSPKISELPPSARVCSRPWRASSVPRGRLTMPAPCAAPP